jgi:hypothetical protein
MFSSFVAYRTDPPMAIGLASIDEVHSGPQTTGTPEQFFEPAASNAAKG